jgi:ABC-type dipeptide/oligopeptide/nickel transport system permease component
MVRYVVQRIGVALLVLLAVSMLSFGLLKLSGDLATSMARDTASAAYVDFLRKEYGLDQPLPIQYLRWLSRALVGDFGNSFFYGRPANQLLAERLPVTMVLGVVGLFIALIFAVPLGVVAAIRPGGILDRLASAIALLGQAAPTFWLCFVMIMLFGINLGWLPVSGTSSWLNFVMPGIALAYYGAPAFLRIVRSGMIDALASDYVRTARAYGLRPPTVLFKHALRNVLVPLVSVAAVQFGFMLGGSVVIETIFALHGVGYLAWEAIAQNDYPVVQAIVLTVSAIYVLLTLAADLLNAAIDPRIRLE